MMSLEGLRVLDLTQHLSGPYCTMILGDLGAEVLKIEKPGDGDDQRKLGPFVHGESSPFMMINRNKKSITLNLKSDSGREILLQLARSCDVLVENFRPGVTASLGIDYETLRTHNPAIVYCSISGYGQTGPDRDKGGFDIMAQGMTGLMHMNSPADGPLSKLPISIHDLGAGQQAVYAILSAYIHRLRTGAGQYVDVSLIEAGLALTVGEAAAYLVNGHVPKVAGTRNHLSAPYQAYRTRDGHIIVGAGNQRLWEKFCSEVVDKPEWIADPRFASASERIRHADDLEELIEASLRQHDTGHWITRLEQAGVPGGPIHSYDEALRHPQVLARDMLVEVDHPRAGRTRMLGIPTKMSLTPGSIRLPAPVLGQHTDEVLAGILSMSAAQIAELRRLKAI